MPLPSNALVVPWTRLAKLRVIFVYWVSFLWQQNIEVLEGSVARLHERLGKMADSIWKMNKAELVKVAMEECGMTMAYAEKQSVIALREKIRCKRRQMTLAEDPKNKLPPNVDRMSKHDLIIECANRDLPLPETPTRPQMIVAIRDDVEQRQLLQQTVADNRAMDAKEVKKQKDPMDGDWEMEDVPKGKGKKEKKDGQ
jgi:hypothetical protein